MENNYCSHCYPSKNTHVQDKMESILNFYMSTPLDYLLTLLFPNNLLQLIGARIQRGILDFSQIIKHSEFTDNIDRSQLNNGILVIWDEAKKRHLKIFNIKFGNRHTQYFVFFFNDRKYYFDRNPIYLVTQKFPYFDDARKYDDKSVLKKVLLEHNIPCPEGDTFISTKKAINYGIELGFPLVVKPVLSSFSRHVSFNIKSKQELCDAINIAKEINYRIVVEKYIPGDVHRVTVLDKFVVACTKRQASKIIGNGTTTVENLIDAKNCHPLRGEPHQLNCSLHKIEKNAHLEKILAEQGVNLNTKLKNGKQIYLSNKMNSGNGADVTNVTSLIHSENKKLFLKIHKILNLPLLGLDFICQDVSVPWHNQPFAIIENNSLPYLDAHHYPSIGEPINVASKIWDFVLESLKK